MSFQKTDAKKIISINPKLVILNDEIYVPLDPTQIPGNQYCNEVEGDKIDIESKIKPKTKFNYTFFHLQLLINRQGKMAKRILLVLQKKCGKFVRPGR